MKTGKNGVIVMSQHCYLTCLCCKKGILKTVVTMVVKNITEFEF